MSSYEFWDELGKIFNAVVAYQEKNLEFNKRFISPWIRLGNVFEKQDRNKEAMNAYERAIEIDGANPQNWFELGNIHFKMENYGEAVTAYQKAIELDPGFGWAHSNLALTLASMGETEQAVALYQKAIELLADVKDRAVAWNRLGNAYRKLNQYDQALEAFHNADELDRENSGFRDSMDEVTDGPTVVEQATEVRPEESVQAPADKGTDGMAVESAAIEEPAKLPELQNQEPEAVTVAVMEEQVAAEPSAAASEPPAEQPVPILATTEGAAEAAPAPAETEHADAQKDEVSAGTANVAPVEETVTVVVQDSTQTFTETLPIEPLANGAKNAGQADATDVETPAPVAAETSAVVTSDEAPEAQSPAPASPIALTAEPSGLEDTQPSAPVQIAEPNVTTAGEPFDPAPNSLADQLLEAEPEVLDVAQRVAYEAFLKDTSEPIGGLGAEEEDEAPVELPGSPEPVAKIDETGELQIEMDTKNAHVWNELGNVYFNTSAFDDAIVAYSKAIELDRWFAWPYSNLALAYVQKRRFVEAILLYQRSIELFGTDKDKAISWNRLGNVYRRLNDYENAIAAYQRADALDPDNSTLSLQSRFSLLGNYAMEQKPSYVS